MNRVTAITAFCVLSGAAVAQPTIEFLPVGYVVTDLSQDGTVAVGNAIGDGTYETFRWTEETGIERLGRASVPVIGRGAGTPDVSYDGSRVSASIITSTNDKLTQGLWDVQTGWTETMPPIPANGVDLDESYGSAWGLSGDGSTVTGFYWTPKAQACTWSSSTGMIALAQDAGRNARVNAANLDASVVVGWEERPDGVWQPRAWRNGVKIVLDPGDAFAEAQGVNSDGEIIVGESVDPATATVVATIWRWDGSSYVVQRVGYLPGTIQTRGLVSLESVSNDGAIAVGFNRFDFNSPTSAGIVWTPSGGLISGTTFIADLGLSIPVGNSIIDFPSVSPDGSAVTGLMLDSRFGFLQSFIIRIPPIDCPGDANGDNTVNSADLSVLLSQFGQDVTAGTGADFNDDGVVNSADLSVLLSSFGTSC